MTGTHMIRLLRTSGVVLAAALLSACASYTAKQQGVEGHLLSNTPQLALGALEEQNHTERDHLAYLLNKAMLLRMDQQYAASNDVLEEGKILIDKLDAVSLREQAAAFTINEGMRSYAGEDFEKVLLHLYKALNFIQLGDLDAARVEALQTNLTLKAITEDYEQGDNSVYAEDPFARYLSGIIFETLNEPSDAMIAYRKAYQGYQHYGSMLKLRLPDSLKHDLLRLSAHMGLDDELAKYQQEFAIENFETTEDRRGRGEILLLLHNGLVPQKRDQTLRIINPANGRLISVSLPAYFSRSLHTSTASLRVNQTRHALQTVEDIDAFARQSLNNQMPALTARAISRAVAKDSLARNAGNNQGNLVGFIINMAGAITEVADTRAWYTLPHNIMMARLSLPPGEYRLNLNANGRSLDLGQVRVESNQLHLLEKHWVRP